MTADRSRLSAISKRSVQWVAASSTRSPAVWLLAVAAITVPAVFLLRGLSIDTELTRMLPTDSRAVVAIRDLGGVVGSRGNLRILFEGDDEAALRHAVRTAAAQIRTLPEVASVEFEHPVDFVNRYRYLLIPSFYLRHLDRMVTEAMRGQLQTAANLSGDANYGIRQNRRDVEQLVLTYGNVSETYQSSDGRVHGLIVRTNEEATTLHVTEDFVGRIEYIAQAVAADAGLTTDVRGSIRINTDELNFIVGDLQKAGTIAGLGILLALLLSFRSVRQLPVVLLPIFVGMTWGFALVEVSIGSLNLTTSFLLIIMFGTGVDYAIHFVKRFETELASLDVYAAIVETFTSTGRSVAVAALTTAIALAGLGVSRFRGFSEFGVVGATVIVTTLAAMFAVLPALLVISTRIRLIRPTPVSNGGRVPVPNAPVTLFVAVVLLGAIGLAALNLTFDYDFRNTRTEVRAVRPVEGDIQGPRTPAAVYVAPNLQALDSTLRIFERSREDSGTTLAHVASVRDLAPHAEETKARLLLISDFQRRLGAFGSLPLSDGPWQRVARDVANWSPPPEPPTIADVPPVLREAYFTRDGSALIVGVHASVNRRDGKMAMAFTKELYDLNLPEGVVGPVGDTAVLAEILWLVTDEGPKLIILIALGVFLVVGVFQRSVSDTVWMLIPLMSGLALTAGALAAAGVSLNFFNIVAIPALLGLGVDHGVHYYQRWLVLGRSTKLTQRELFGPLSACSATTVAGYAGLLASGYPGLRSIGIVATLGLGAIWFTSVFFFPGLLQWRDRFVTR